MGALPVPGAVRGLQPSSGGMRAQVCVLESALRLQRVKEEPDLGQAEGRESR